MNKLVALFDEFINERIVLQHSPQTIKAHRVRAGSFIRYMAAQHSETITRRDILAFVSQIVGKGSSPFTVRSYVESICTFCSWLVDYGELPTNPASKIGVRTPKLKPASYDKKQVAALLAECERVRDKAIIVTLLDTGLRAAELCSMRWPDSNSDTFYIIGKASKERPVFLNPITQMMINTYVERERGPEEGFLWLSKTRTPMTPRRVHEMIGRTATRAGIRQNIRKLVHGFRATFAKSYTRAGGDLESLRELLGHTSITMAAHYAQLNTEELQEKKNTIDPLALAVDLRSSDIMGVLIDSGTIEIEPY